MSTPNGYNNPAYCHQYDSSLYDYQYVPEIDPDSPDLNDEKNRRNHETKLVPSTLSDLQRDFSESDSFEGSDESNRSIIIEECNNRRVTLICEKRTKPEANQDEFYEDGSYRGAYYQDISLESEKYSDNRNTAQPLDNGGRNDERSLRHMRPLEPPKQTGDVHSYSGFDDSGRQRGFKQPLSSYNSQQRPQRYHRYEEIPSDYDFNRKNSINPTSVHRYAEITSDENGYPTLTKEIKIEESYPYNNSQKNNYQSQTIPKPRAVSPTNYPKSFSPPLTPGRTYQRPPYSNESESLCIPQLSPKSTSPFVFSSSPNKSNSFEMAELSPPRLTHNLQFNGNDQTFFINSPKRQPPIGESASAESQEQYLFNEKCIIPKNLQQISIKSKNRSHSLPSTPKRKKDGTFACSSSNTAQSERKITQIFHIKPVKSSADSKFKFRASERSNKKENHPVRRNISSSFSEYPREYTMSPKLIPRSPYKPTTTEIVSPKTAIITPIFQRKNQQNQEGEDFRLSPKRNFEKMSHAFQSTGNIFRSAKEATQMNEVNFPLGEEVRKMTRIKRNQSVPNFTQSLAAENRIMAKKGYEMYQQENQKYSRNLDLQYSPKKPVEHVSSIDKSKISLMDQTRSSWSMADSDFQLQCSSCFIIAAIVHLVTSTATCAISFYLLSRIGRKYFLDFGLLAGFVNFMLGLLGFRSYCWKWFPNRNYVSGFIGLAAFSALSCAGLSYLIIAKPMAGDPILDIMGGAICAVSILTITLALAGLTMSGCCKAPPPDNREEEEEDKEKEEKEEEKEEEENGEEEKRKEEKEEKDEEEGEEVEKEKEEKEKEKEKRKRERQKKNKRKNDSTVELRHNRKLQDNEGNSRR